MLRISPLVVLCALSCSKPKKPTGSPISASAPAADATAPEPAPLSPPTTRSSAYKLTLTKVPTNSEVRTCLRVDISDGQGTNGGALACSTGVTNPQMLGSVPYDNLLPFSAADSSGFRSMDLGAPDGSRNVAAAPVTIDGAHPTLGGLTTALAPCQIKVGFQVYVPLKVEKTTFTDSVGLANKFFKCNANTMATNFSQMWDSGHWNGTNTYWGNRYVSRPCGLYSVSSDAPSVARYYPRKGPGVDDNPSQTTHYISTTENTTGRPGFGVGELQYLARTRMEIMANGTNSYLLRFYDGGFWGGANPVVFNETAMESQMEAQLDIVPDSAGQACTLVMAPAPAPTPAPASVPTLPPPPTDPAPADPTVTP